MSSSNVFSVFFCFFLVYSFFVFESSSIMFDFFVLILFSILLVFFCFSGLGMFGLLFSLLYLSGFMFLFLVIVLILNVPFYVQKLSLFFVLVSGTCFFVFCGFHFMSNNFFLWEVLFMFFFYWLFGLYLN